MQENSDYHSNMVSNLPLLFANGYPTSLDKITEGQIQNFIPFMVQCSLGNINVPGKEIYSEPEWWPEDIKFEIPITKPKKFSGNWLQKMRDIVKICYQFHKSIFLLRFCNELALYEHEWLRFINNYNSTTSLFDRRSNKLLVTFRNENMTYEQQQKNRKCLLQQKNNNNNNNNNNSQQQQMVEPALFDIYLCDNCDAELYSLEAITEHEKTCTSDDDVIICNSPTPDRELQSRTIESSTKGEQLTDDMELRRDFLLNFNLQYQTTTTTTRGYNKKQRQIKFNEKQLPSSSCSNNFDNNNLCFDNVKKTTTQQKKGNGREIRRNRSVYTLSKCPIIPLSSPAGQLLIKTAKTNMTDEYMMERLDRIERFCNSTIIQNPIHQQQNQQQHQQQQPQQHHQQQRPRFLNKRNTILNTLCTFKKPQDYPIHMYTFPRRQFTSKYRTDCLLFLNALLIKRCRPIFVRLRKITDNDIKRNMICNTELSPSDLNIKLIRDQSHGSSWKITSQQQQQQQIVVDTINLCSSDDDDDDNNDNDVNNKLTITSNKNLNEKIPNKLLKKLELKSTSSELELKNIFNKLNSEVTLSPITRNKLLNEQNRLNTIEINNCNSSSSSSSDSNCSKISNLQQASTTTTTTTTPVSAFTNNQLKPLQPSVFLFSNFTNNNKSGHLPIHQFHDDSSNNLNIFNNHHHHNQQQQNQENCMDNNVIKTQDDNWLPNNNNNNINNNIINTNHHLRNNVVVSNERTTKKVFQHYINDISISSPNRTISIDLTL